MRSMLAMLLKWEENPGKRMRMLRSVLNGVKGASFGTDMRFVVVASGESTRRIEPRLAARKRPEAPRLHG
jgi:hypothetical protein